MSDESRIFAGLVIFAVVVVFVVFGKPYTKNCVNTYNHVERCK